MAPQQWQAHPADEPPNGPLGGAAELIHWLNQRYKQEWDRAERLQAELTALRSSGAWRLVCWLRRLKDLLRRPRPARPPARAAAPRRLEFASRTARGRVSILIPFRNRAALLRNVLRGLAATSYRRFEVVLIDNGSDCPRTRRYVQRLRQRRRIRVVACPGPFNFASLCNAGAAEARGDFLLFLNNDIQVLDPTWLAELLVVAGQPAVGVAGATLVYPDGTLQHAGIFPQQDRSWVHVYRGQPGDYPGAWGELRHVREVPAVTGACLMIRRALFGDLGGFDERLPVTGNDVDLCRRVRRRGLAVAITPHARLCHFESLSRGYSLEPPTAATGDFDLV